MRVVLDSNIFVSALMAQNGTAGFIYKAWRKGRFEVVTSDAQLTEIKRISRYPKVATKIPRQAMGEALSYLQNAIVFERVPRKHQCHDPEDAYLLDLTEVSGADFLVTGDRRAGLLERRKVGRASILSTSAFAQRLQ